MMVSTLPKPSSLCCKEPPSSHALNCTEYQDCVAKDSAAGADSQEQEVLWSVGVPGDVGLVAEPLNMPFHGNEMPVGKEEMDLSLRKGDSDWKLGRNSLH